MRRVLITMLIAIIAVVGCSTKVSGKNAKKNAALARGFEVVRFDDAQVTVRIGKTCTAEVILEMDGELKIGRVYDSKGNVIRGDVSDDAIGPDQYKGDPEAGIATSCRPQGELEPGGPTMFRSGPAFRGSFFLNGS